MSSETGSLQELYVNRELSFLAFNQRIVEEAKDITVPLLERLKFISIIGMNLDEFLMVRVAGLQQKARSGILASGPDKLLPKEQLTQISLKISEQTKDYESVLLEDVIPKLSAAGVALVMAKQLTEEERTKVKVHALKTIFPMLTPLAVDPGHPFPFLKNRSLNLAIHLLPPDTPPDAFPLLALVHVPALLPRLVPFERVGVQAFVLMEDIVQTVIPDLFPGMQILECVPCRVIRNWDLKFDEDAQEDLLETVQKELRYRWRLDAAHLEVDASMSDQLLERLRDALELTSQDVTRHQGPVGVADLASLLDYVGRADLRDSVFYPIIPFSLIAEENMFSAISKSDVLLHHPYDSYEPVLDFLEQAARDPKVFAIKITLYRVHKDSSLLRSLTLAAESGKQVTALVELKARFDEEVNLRWARALEQAGVHVVYGISGLKTHCKVTLVVRRESSGIRRYVHMGTGNYNEQTAKLYSDLSYFTDDDDIAEDISSLFNLLTGYSSPRAWRKLIVAPLDLRRTIIRLIQEVEDAAKKNLKARIVLKSNALIDLETIRALSRASQAGAEVILLIRGPCGLRVGVEGLSDKIVVRVIVDRFLEHDRILYFGIEDDATHLLKENVFITSTDIMPRNFDRRVEVMLPIEDERIKRRIIDEILAIELADTEKSTELGPKGEYVRRAPKEGHPSVRAQARFMELALSREQGSEDQKAGASLLD